MHGILSQYSASSLHVVFALCSFITRQALVSIPLSLSHLYSVVVVVVLILVLVLVLVVVPHGAFGGEIS